MNPSQFTKKSLIRWGGEAIYTQAEQLVRRGAVLKADMKGDLISGVIARESASEIYTKLRLLAPDKIESLCPCFTNQHSGQVCPHVVALGIALMLRHTDPLREQKYQEDQRRARRLEQVDEGAYLQRDPHGTPARLGLTLTSSWTDDFWRGRVVLRLLLLTDTAIISPDKAPRNTRYRLSPEDDNLLLVLEDICEGPPPDSIELSPSDFLNVLAVASHARLAVAGNGEVVVEAIAMQTHLRVDLAHETGELIIFPFTELPFLRPGEIPVYLVNNRQGRVFANGHIWPMKNVLPIPYHGIYQAEEVVPRDRVINFLRRDLPTLMALTPVTLELTPDLFVTAPGKPAFHLELQGSKASLRATLKAVYGNRPFCAGMPDTQVEFALPDPDDILRYQVRNLPAEKAAVDALLQYGFQEDRSDTVAAISYTLVGTRETLNFLGSGYPALGRSGWKIVFSGKLASLVDEIPVVTPVVQIAEKNGGWFDVGFTFDLPGRAILPPAEVQRALNRGDAFLERDGQTVLIDREAVESMRAIFNDCQSRESSAPGHFLMPSVYAPFVQASLNALDGIDVEDPPDWREKAAANNRSGGNARLRPVSLGALDKILRPYQKEGVYWLRFLEESGLHGLLADEMGLGKTLQTLAWLSLPRTDPQAQGKPALIVCPTSLVENWNREAEAFVPQLRRLVISGPDRETLFAKLPESDLVITSYALLRRDLDAYRAFQFSVAVLDEAQHIKNRSTQNAVAAKQVNAVGKLVLTGTPVENSVADLWSIMDFLMPQYLGEYEEFRGRYELPIAAGDRDGELAQSKLRRKLHPFLLRRLKKDVAKDLPDKIIKVSFCPLTLDQQRVYNDLLAESRRTIGDLVKAKGFERSRFEILAILMRLRQTCCHLDLLKDHHKPGTYEAPSAKLDAFLELLDEAMDGGHRILVFSQFVTMLKLLRVELEQRGHQHCYLDGSTQDRLAQCQRFNLNPDIPVFLISLKAGGTGLNLTGADMVVHFDPWWNPAVEDQATDRAHRIGQKRTVYSIKLIAEHTVEEKVLAMQQRKQAVINATVGTTDETVMQKLSFDDIRDLIGL
jgi:superfamily II DNA or RNA helicase